MPKYVVCTVLVIGLAISACTHNPSVQSSKPSSRSKPLPEVKITKQSSYGEYEAKCETNPSYDEALAQAFVILSAHKHCTEMGMYTLVGKKVNVDKWAYYTYFDLSFDCLKNFVFLVGAGELESVSKELVTPYTHDFRGGVLINKPQAPFKRADVIINMGSTRIDDYESFRDYLAGLKEASKVQVTILRNGKKVKVSGKLEDSTPFLWAASSDTFQSTCRFLTSKGEKLEYCETDKTNKDEAAVLK